MMLLFEKQFKKKKIFLRQLKKISNTFSVILKYICLTLKTRICCNHQSISLWPVSEDLCCFRESITWCKNIKNSFFFFCAPILFELIIKLYKLFHIAWHIKQKKNIKHLGAQIISVRVSATILIKGVFSLKSN